jgi:hypothetical protein
VAREDTLALNATLEFIEFVIGTVDEADDTMTVGQLRREFKEKFKHDLQPLINRHFGIIRLIPLMHMVEDRLAKAARDVDLDLLPGIAAPLRATDPDRGASS